MLCDYCRYLVSTPYEYGGPPEYDCAHPDPYKAYCVDTVIDGVQIALFHEEITFFELQSIDPELYKEPD